MFKNMKLAGKIAFGFGLVVVFMMVVGGVGFGGAKGIVNNMNDISYQTEIVKKINTVLTDTQDMQAHVLQFLIYGDDQYVKGMKEEYGNVMKGISSAKDLMKSVENKNKADEAAKDAAIYDQGSDKLVKLSKEKAEAGELRTRLAASVMEKVKKVIELENQAITSHIKEIDGMRVVPQDAQEKLNLSYNVLEEFAEVRITAQKFQMAVTSEDQNELAKAWLAGIDEVKKSLQECESIYKDAATLQQLREAKTVLGQYEEQVEVFRKLNNSQQETQATLRETSYRLMQTARDVRDGVYEYMGQVDQKADRIAGLVSTTISLVFIFAVVISVIAAVFIIRSITRPIHRVIDGLATGSEQVTSASGQVSAASQQLAQGASEQASSLEETSSSLEEMASMTRQNADNANQANNIAKDASSLAAGGVEAMQRMTGAIDKIKKSSDETAKIIKTIDEIAFQTNLLALNAAVEAARAGEAGKGFAVVAEEVRNLARRSAEAAKNTADLIEGAQKNSEEGVAVTSEVAKSLSGIKEANNKVATLIAEIAAASKEQAQGIDQVNTAVSEMDKVVQQNAANAEESASASEELSSQAQELNAMVEQLTAIVGGAHSNGKHAVVQIRKASALKTATTSHKALEGSKPQTLKHVAHLERANAHPQKKEPVAASARPEDVIPLDEKEFKEF
jgi:methyl-accepting chemotaxis protein